MCINECHCFEDSCNPQDGTCASGTCSYGWEGPGFNCNERTDNIIELDDNHPEMSPITVTNNGVKKLLLNLKVHKATGPDGIPARLLKALANEITPVFSLFFQASLEQGIIPTAWKTAEVVPIFKKGAKKRPENYRPVSLTSISCKMLEHKV